MDAPDPTHPLTGRRVVVTRASHQSQPLTDALRAAGADVVGAPAIAIVPPAGGGQPLDDALLRLDRFTWVAFTSANAVAATFARADRRVVRHCFDRLRVAAVGPATADRVAQEIARPPDLVPQRHSAAALAEAFPPPSRADLPDLGRTDSPAPGRTDPPALGRADPPDSIVQDHCLVPMAQDGRPDLVDGLRARGWQVTAVAAYRTIQPSLPQHLLDDIATAHAVVFASPSAVQGHLAQLAEFGRRPDPTVAVVCIGDTTAETYRLHALESSVAGATLAVTVAQDTTSAHLVAAVAAAITVPAATTTTPAPAATITPVPTTTTTPAPPPPNYNRQTKNIAQSAAQSAAQPSIRAATFDEARAVIPGGVNSPVRAFGSVGGTPYFVARAGGAYLTDTEGNNYVDLICSYGAVICGHAHPAVTAAISAAAATGTSYSVPTLAETQLARVVCDRVPGIEQVRLVSSGTEATMTAVRLARGHTGRSRVIKFAGNYHGHSDSLLAAGGSGVATLGLSGSAGVPPGAVADTVVAPYNVVPELDDQIAAVIVEPVAANMGVIAPMPGFLAGLRQACDAAGALLIFDEVITGFRLARGGATEHFGVTPDLACFGKVIGGGLPIGAVGGTADVMASLAPLGPVYQAGTLSGNPLATAAGLTVLEMLDDDAYRRLTATATYLADGLTRVFDEVGFAALVSRVGSLVGIFCGDAGAPTDYDSARRTDESAYSRLFHALANRGVALAPGAYEALFVTLAHTDEVIGEVLSAATEALSTQNSSLN